MKSLAERKADRIERREDAGAPLPGGATDLNDAGAGEGSTSNEFGNTNAEIKAWIEERGGKVEGSPNKATLIAQATELKAAGNQLSGNGGGQNNGWGQQ